MLRAPFSHNELGRNSHLLTKVNTIFTYLQVVKNLVFLGRVLKNVSIEGHTEETEGQDSEEQSDNETKLSLVWMIQRMRKIVNAEIVQAPKSTAMVSLGPIA